MGAKASPRRALKNRQSFTAKAAEAAKENKSLNAKAAKEFIIENQPKDAKTTPSGEQETPSEL